MTSDSVQVVSELGQPHDLIGILSAVEETAYTWDIAADSIEWESNVASVLHLAGHIDVSTGTAFQLLIASEHIAQRQTAIGGARATEPGKSIPFRVQYRFSPGGRRTDAAIWLEDHGRWWAGPDGKPIAISKSSASCSAVIMTS